MSSAVPMVPQSRIGDWLRRGEATLAATCSAALPPAEFLNRLVLGQAFLMSGLLKAGNWENALLLAREEYPVPWMDPVMAAWLGVLIEIVGGLLLTLGLATRAAALAMLLLTLVSQIHYVQLDTHLYWMAAFLGLVLCGPESLSLDVVLGPGLARAPLPLVSRLRQPARRIARFLVDVYPLLFRLWLGAALMLAASGASPEAWPALPLESLGALRHDAVGVLGLMLFVGLGVRIASLLLLLLIAESTLMMSIGWQLGWLVLLLDLPLLVGSGPLALEHLLGRFIARRLPGWVPPTREELARWPRVLIIGAGFGGLACARALRHAPVRVTVLDRNNYHLFQPLLYQVATAGLNAADIATPVRELLRDQRNAEVLLGEVDRVDAGNRCVHTRQGELDYDFLVLATGASHSYFGRDEWAEHAPGLKTLEHAAAIRRRVLLAFERAEAESDPLARRAWLTFVIVGAGPTGVELAGAIAELARHGLREEFRHIEPAATRVLLLQSGERVLPAFPEALAQAAATSLTELGVDVRCGSRVTDIDASGVTVGEEHIDARTVLWAAGVVASPAARWLGAPADRAGRILVQPDLRVPGHDAVWAIGDTASVKAWKGREVPGLAPAAKQMGEYAAGVIRAKVSGLPEPKPFRYRHLGSLATIGRKSAVADFGWLRLRGAPAWWLWGAVHVAFLVGVRNRVSVLWNWAWSWLTFRAATRLITEAAD